MRSDVAGTPGDRDLHADDPNWTLIDPCGGLRFAIIDINTRKLRHFVVLAEELHFSRAAARVYLAQQALSRQIRDLEDELGVKLLERSTRVVALTPAGEVFLAGARAALAALDGAAETARRTVRGLAGTLRLGYAPGAALELTPYIVAEFRRTHPDVVVEMHEHPIGDPSAGLASGESDVAFLRLPQDTARIETEVLLVDPVVAMVSTAHRFAERASVSAHDLTDDPITQSPGADDVWHAFWSLETIRAESSQARIVPVTSITEEAQVVAAGVAVAVTSSAVARLMSLPGVRYLPIDDWPGSSIAVGWPTDERSPLVTGFVDAACVVRDRESEMVAMIENRP
ncbi:LysR substrate-binding domain-containing protein [Mycolicibacter acidiphilus]|uniref:LysR substrate-binding domain-containing protein n=1 Tax=Mycolicibacter acidiphilus TaxID=2835306 RepID=UPI0027DE5705|nr:LysR substrate-binding domain-containing protein [Mycolicibacter acidiphilus]